MKRSLFIVLSLMLTLVISAGNVTPEEALQQASKFMNERVAKGARRAPATASNLMVAKNVSGLYVINMGSNDGFVIVSPDDRTVPVLGYADKGTLDPDKMPDNMRSWLQGYADEIAWLDAHNYQPSAVRRTASAVKVPIAPLITTHWNQGAPYNNQVTSYAPDSISGVTGCVATALSQVMYYTARQAGLETSTPADDIPGYTVGSTNMDIPGISAYEVIRWDLMRDTYDKSDTDEGADAVATLMRICGVLMQMEYNNNISSAQGEDIPPLLQYYFGYAETIQTADRSYYSYANWIDMLYNELEQGRPIVYGGQSISSGHEFICDGYEGEDYFHINWGWGGLSDGYFQLSVLNTKEQGIGGSSSDDGYTTGQHAVIGIQLKGGTGTVLSNPNNIDLTLNSVTTDKDTLNVGETAHIIFNITNNSTDDYDGEFGFSFFDKGLGDGKMFMIPAGGTQDCVMDFHPTSVGTYKLTAYKTDGHGRFLRMSDMFVKLVVTDTIEANPVTDEIDLVSTLVVDNSESDKFYGTTLKATLTIKNPDSLADYSGYYEYLLQKREGKSLKTVTYNSSKINIHANDSLNVLLEFPNLALGVKYRLLVVQYYLNTGQWGDWQSVGDEYTCSPAIATYVADGTMSVVPSSETRYDAPAGVVFVNITGMGITDVTHVEPNCTFLGGTADAIPTGATNYVQYDGNEYTAPNLTLTNDHDFYSPVDFMADNIEFTYNCDRWADGTKGWNTIMLPFDVTSVTADGAPIDWFHSKSDTGKQFWLKEFVSDDTDVVNFDYVSGMMQANTPYIIALPGNHWGAEMDLTGKTIKFIGSGVVKKSAPGVLTASHYRFVADTKADDIENIYCIDSIGSKFELKATGGSKAFHPFFKPGIYDRDIVKPVPTAEYLAIGGNETTGISTLNVERVTSNEIYNLNGQRVVQPKKGLYIKNGVKVVVK